MNTATEQQWIDYDYAVVRVVPQVHLCTFANVGVVLHARTAGFLDARFHVDRERLARDCPDLDLDVLERYVAAYGSVCRGGRNAGPVGLLPPSERFHWLTAPRSAVLQTSEIHAGRTRDPRSALDHLFTSYVGGVGQ
jgi:hypothetical protein